MAENKLEQPVTKKYLGEFTETIILPSIATMVAGVEKKLDKMGGRLDTVEKRLDKIEGQMVTKDYLDDKLADQTSDFAILIRKEDKKLAVLVALLRERKVLTDDDVKKILSLEPFPQS